MIKKHDDIKKLEMLLPSLLSRIKENDNDSLEIDENDTSNTFNENLQFKLPYETRISSTIKNTIKNDLDILSYIF